MKRFTIVLVAMAMLMSTAAFAAEDGAAIFKAKCAMCHGAMGEGKGKAPALKGNTMAEDVLTKGGKGAPHVKPMASLTDDQVKAVATFVAGLK